MDAPIQGRDPRMTGADSRPVKSDKAEAFGRLGFREVTAADQAFLLDLFASTRPQELAAFGDNEIQKRAFVMMQFSALSRSYSSAHSRLITTGGTPVGRIVVDERRDELRLVDIALMPQFRNTGIGTVVVKGLMDEAAAKHLCVRLHVFKYSDAVRFYHRLGFQSMEDDGSYLRMEWQPNNSTSLAPPDLSTS